MKVHISDFDGHALIATASTDYTVWRNVGVGIRYVYTDVSVDVDRRDFNGNFGRRMNSLNLYARLLF